MKLKKLLLITLATTSTVAITAQNAVAHFDMSLANGKISEQVTHTEYIVNSKQPACALTGLDGQALRFDGYSNYVKAGLPNSLSSETLTIQILLAA